MTLNEIHVTERTKALCNINSKLGDIYAALQELHEEDFSDDMSKEDEKALNEGWNNFNNNIYKPFEQYIRRNLMKSVAESIDDMDYSL